MTSTSSFETAPTFVCVAANGIKMELVRGQEQSFLERWGPVVRRQSVTLDLAPVERIDAAGLAALVALYCDACKAGHNFSVARPGRHVREMLALVGLDRILLASEATVPLQASVEQNAA